MGAEEIEDKGRERARIRVGVEGVKAVQAFEGAKDALGRYHGRECQNRTFRFWIPQASITRPGATIPKGMSMYL
jgi:hypothetical protein